MAINLITQPDASTPTGNDDYTQQNILINGNVNQVAPDAFVLSLWESSLTVPTIKQGTYIRHAGNMYVVDSTDETIAGTPAAGINYIVLVVSGTTLTATWATSYVGYTWNPAYNGWYNGTNQVIFQGVYKEGVNFISAHGVNNDPDKFRLANGDFRYLVGSVYVNNTVSANTLTATNAYLTSFKNQPNADIGIRFDNGTADGPEAIFASAGYTDWYIDAILGRIRFVQGVAERAAFSQADGSFTVANNLTVGGNTNINAGFANSMSITGGISTATLSASSVIDAKGGISNSTGTLVFNDNVSIAGTITPRDFSTVTVLPSSGSTINIPAGYVISGLFVFCSVPASITLQISDGITWSTVTTLSYSSTTSETELLYGGAIITTTGLYRIVSSSGNVGGYAKRF